MPRNLANAYCPLQRLGNLRYWVRMPVCNRDLETTHLIMQDNYEDTPWLTPDQIVIAIDIASTKLIQMLWASKQLLPETNTAFVGVAH